MGRNETAESSRGEDGMHAAQIVSNLAMSVDGRCVCNCRRNMEGGMRQTEGGRWQAADSIIDDAPKIILHGKMPFAFAHRSMAAATGRSIFHLAICIRLVVDCTRSVGGRCGI